MARSRVFDSITRALRVALAADRLGLSTRSAIERAAAPAPSRRRFLAGVGGVAAAAAVSSVAGRAAAKVGSNARIAILGGGLSGLVCADRLRARGLSATIYEAASRLGGRCHSNRDDFPGQVAERGGELIDNGHKTMLAYANEFGLAREDLGKAPGGTAYHFFGQHYTEEEVVAELRELVGRMRPDLQSLSGAPSARAHNAADVALDAMSLEEYLADPVVGRARDLPLVREVLRQAYIAEYGREIHEQSALGFLLYIHVDRRSRFEPFGSSDERYHLVGGNDAIVSHIAARLPGPIVTGARVAGLRRLASGQYAIRFAGSAVEEIADAVVCTIPFSVLRNVTLDASLGLSPEKLNAIRELGYGQNAKTMIGFDARPWIDLHGSSGTAYTDLANVQNTWETNYTAAGAHAILTDYSGGARGAALQIQPGGCASCHVGRPGAGPVDETIVQAQAEAFLTDLDVVYPGARAAASRRPGGSLVVHRAHWLVQSTQRGSYTCYLPGQFTSIGGLEGEPADLLKFAGEHADSWFSYQGFMEGACIAGLTAANALLDDIKAGRL